MRVHQLGHGLIPGDAISNHMLEINRRLRSWGLATRLFARHVSPEYKDIALTDDHFPLALDQADDLLIYHYSIYDPNYRFFQMTRGRKILVYHNITPPHFFRGWDQTLEALCHAGRWILTELQDCDLALGDSDFNRRELVQAGFAEEKTGVLPIFLARGHLNSMPADRGLMARLQGKPVDVAACQPQEKGINSQTIRAGSPSQRQQHTVNFLTVGRVVPNKAIDDVIRIFSVYHRAINPLSRLYIVGSRYLPAYNAALDTLVGDLALDDAIIFTGRVSDAELETYFQVADLYLHASHHEGFCVPLLESMYFGVPILARKATAVPETLGDAGVLFTRLGYEDVAEMAHFLVSDDGLRQQVIRTQNERLQELGPEQAEAALRDALTRVGLPAGPDRSKATGANP